MNQEILHAQQTVYKRLTSFHVPSGIAANSLRAEGGGKFPTAAPFTSTH